MTAIPDVPMFTLNNGDKMPAIGLGVWMGQPGEEDRAEEMCKKALKVGYRLFDTAAGYGNEAAVGRAIRASGIPREEIFVTTKLKSAFHDKVQEAFEGSLKLLDIDYIDLYLVHWPQASKDGQPLEPDEYPTIIDTWKQMEKLLDTGKVRAIGLSNFDSTKIDRIIKECRIIPAVNQVEQHPCLPQNELLEFCSLNGIVITSYSTLGRPGTNPDTFSFFQDETFKKIATKYNADVGQVVLSWAVQKGISVIPKSESEARQKSNLTLLKLDADDFVVIDDFHKREGMHRSLLDFHSTTPPYGVFGWSYEWLGWPMGKGGVVISS